MATKNTNSGPATASKLVISKEEFKKELENQIEKGKELVNFEVPLLGLDNDPFFGRSARRAEYRPEEKKAFFSRYNKWSGYNIELLKQSFDIPDNEYKKSYEDVIALIFVGNDIVKQQKDTINYAITFLEGLIEKLSLLKCVPTVTTVAAKKPDVIAPINNKRVFIVHGHDELLKTKVELLLVRLGLEPIILHKQANKNRTIIEKIEAHSDVGFAVVLFTGDDMGKAKDNAEYQKRARQNVVLEMGFFMGKLGRERAMAIVEADVEIPGDLSGMVYTLADGSDKWQNEVCKELKAAGLKINDYMP